MGLIGVLLVLHDLTIIGKARYLAGSRHSCSLIGITLGTLYQKRFCGPIDWRTGNLIQFCRMHDPVRCGRLIFETLHVVWSGEFIFALFWLVVVLSILTIALMYWLIKRIPQRGSRACSISCRQQLRCWRWLLFNERLDALSISGIVLCAAAVFIVNYRKGVSVSS